VIGAALTESIGAARAAVTDADRAAARRRITADADACPTLAASGHRDGSRWSDDELFDTGLDAVLTAGKP
jgi:hypothetical protein